MPHRFYLKGFISPRCEDEAEAPPPSQAFSVEESGDGFDEVADDKIVESVRQEARDLAPRSIGISVSPTNRSGIVEASFQWGEYRFESGGENPLWVREPKSHTISRSVSELESNGVEDCISDLHPGIRFQFKHSTRRGQDIITVRVVNDRTFKKKDWQMNAESTIHQMKIKLSGHFQDVRAQTTSVSDPTMDLLYHYSNVFSFGHNVGVGWSEKGDEAWTDYIPRYEVPLMRQRKELQDLIPTLQDLVNPEKVRTAVESIEEFVRKYEDWIKSQRKEFTGIEDIQHLGEHFEKNLQNANENIQRMRSGVQTLLSDSTALEAFRLANQSILESQTSPTLEELHRIPNFQWRPFQFAFQLINLDGILKVNHHDRKLVDLAWFPTGGGKTEAYLGLIAILSFYRRLRPESAILEQKGPAIHTIMRYTLRLLTADQAARLVRAVGAMNTVAEQNEIGVSSGFPPFRVGMWVGQKSSPNRFYNNPKAEYSTQDSAHDVILNSGTNVNTGESRVSQFQKCPWCGDESIGDQRRYTIAARPWSLGRPTLHVSCDNDSCPFRDELPFTPVDEDLYLNPPTILLATADKFVQIANNQNARSIDFDPEARFAQIDGSSFTIRRMLGFEGDKDDHISSSPLPPDLVIQDELHLLTGPLGTVAGLFETALDLAWKRHAAITS